MDGKCLLSEYSLTKEAARLLDRHDAKFRINHMVNSNLITTRLECGQWHVDGVAPFVDLEKSLSYFSAKHMQPHANLLKQKLELQ